jgi:uncharacterized repeat protein (TIGR01451 family)
VRRLVTGKKTGNWIGVTSAFLAVVIATAGVVFHFATAVHAAKAGGRPPAVHKSLASESLPKSLSLPLFFEPNQGQTAPQVKFLAHGAGYGLFLTADEAVLQLQPSAVSTPHSAVGSQRAPSSVIRMRLDGANSLARVSGASPLPGKSNYFIGNDPSKWRRDIPQFARVQYQAVYPGIDLVYYGNQGQLEYDFRVAPGAEPSQIALSFKGASAHIDSGDLLLSTDQSDVRFHAPRIYQQDGNTQKSVAGGFRQIADNRIGFTIGAYDHSRELVIDPVLSYSTYLGGSGTEALVKIAVDANQTIYVAGSTNSTNFPVTDGSTLKGAQNIFISKINPTLSGTAQLVYSIYLGGTQSDNLAGIAVDSAFGIYVAGSTTSPDFPTLNGLPSTVTGGVSHGFLSKLTLTGTAYGLSYSTYLAGNGIDTVTGLAIDSSSDENAFVTGDTTSSNLASDGFPANPNGFQTVSNSPGHLQFFASKINTGGSGSLSMLYSTYFGGGNPAGATASGGGIAVDTSGNMYITGTTNMLPVVGGNQEAKFPLFNAQQSCLDEASKTICTPGFNTSPTDAFVAKINPNQAGSAPFYSTYLGGSGSDVGAAVAVDSSGNAYVTGSTNSGDWVCTTSCVAGFQPAYAGSLGATNAFIAKIGNLTGSVYPVTYFTYLGGVGPDSGQDIKVDAVQAAHVAGSTSSPNFPTTLDAFQPGYGGAGDAFVALISTTLAGQAAGDYSSFLGGNQLDQGTGIAFDNIFGATYVAGATRSSNFPFPIPPPPQLPYQGQLNGPQDAFVTKIGASSALTLAPSSTSPAPSPVAAGTQVAFTFNITNNGPDTATNVTFFAIVPTTGLASTPTAKVTSGSGSCSAASGATIQCIIPTLAMNAVGAVEVDVTPSITGNVTQVSVSGSASANGGIIQGSISQQVNVVDFSIAPPSPAALTVKAGDPASIIQLKFCPTNTQLGYSATITPSQTTSPAMVTATTPVFNPTTVTLSGSSCQITSLSIATVARPVTTGSLLRRSSFYAAWLPIGGLSLVGLGLGAGRKRRRWLAGAVLGVIAGAILLQAGCGSSSSSVSTGGGTAAGTYIVTITGSAATGAAHSTIVTMTVL